MRLPIICLDVHFANFLARFRPCFSKPQYQYFVTILLGLVLGQSGCTLSGVLRQVEAACQGQVAFWRSRRGRHKG